MSPTYCARVKCSNNFFVSNFLASTKSQSNFGGASGSGVVFLGRPLPCASGVASGAVAAFAFGFAFALALGSAAAALGSAATALEDAPPLSASADACIDTVFGCTSLICSDPPFRWWCCYNI